MGVHSGTTLNESWRISIECRAIVDAVGDLLEEEVDGVGHLVDMGRFQPDGVLDFRGGVLDNVGLGIELELELDVVLGAGTESDEKGKGR